MGIRQVPKIVLEDCKINGNFVYVLATCIVLCFLVGSGIYIKFFYKKSKSTVMVQRVTVQKRPQPTPLYIQDLESSQGNITPRIKLRD
jgi:hypothetical protein